MDLAFINWGSELWILIAVVLLLLFLSWRGMM